MGLEGRFGVISHLLYLASILAVVYSKPFADSSKNGKSAMDLINNINKGIKDKLFEGDIFMSQNVRRLTMPSTNGAPPGVLFDAVRNREHLWLTRTVPYEFSKEYSNAEKDLIKTSMETIENNTCIKFKERENEKHWIFIVKGGGCSSQVGRIYWKPGKQSVSLEEHCLEPQIILHELLHTLGFTHEQNRPDRDKYVEIFWENIEDGAEDNFRKYPIDEGDTLGVPYDYRSVMHYTKTSASKNGKPTILAIGNKSQELGTAEGLTSIDILQINILYDCAAVGVGVSSSKGYMSSWSRYSPCDESCEKRRQRFCSHKDLSKCPKVNKHGVEEQVTKCTREECYVPIDGHWSRWSDYGECVPECGPRKRSRRRYCVSPKPRYGGKPCVGTDIESLPCSPKICSVKCSFDSDWCGWRNDYGNSYRFRWWMQKGSSPSANTGPTKDHTTGSGSYIHVEASNPALKGNKARFLSKMRTGAEVECLSFWHHMYGQHIGSLRVFLKFEGDAEKKVWEKFGNQGNKWIFANVTVYSKIPYQVIFEAERGDGYAGDIAVDDTNVEEGRCGRSNLEKITGMAVKAIGCYNDNSNDRGLPILLASNRQFINWFKYESFLEKTLRHCAEKAKKNGLRYFGLQYYGECWGSSKKTDPLKHKPSKECINGKYKPCIGPEDEPCTGQANANYIYELI